MKSKEWTLMFYFASDNPLASTIVSQLKAIKDAGYHPDANVIAHFDPHDPNTPTHVFDVNHVSKFWYPNRSEVGFASNNPFVRDLVLDRLWGENNESIRQTVVDHVAKPEWTPAGVTFDPPKPTAEMDGEQDPDKALESFLKFCRESYPARHYMLFILGHGQVVGNDNLLYDDHAAKKTLTLTKLGEVLRTFNADVQNDTERGQVELITLHSCSMSAMEVAYELKGAANYMLASQGPNYVGNLPYKQILIRVFNDLNAEIAPEDINGNHGNLNGKQSLVERLSRPTEPVAQFIRGKLSAPTVAALEKFKPETQPDAALLSEILKEINKLLEREDTDDELLKLIPRNGTNGTNGNGTNGRRLYGAVNRRRVNRLLLAKAFPEISGYPKTNVETMLSKIFYYSLYNSYDFQLAGYPYDLCLTNLTKVSDTEDPINQLADSLIKGLQDSNPIPKQLILLAHWDAQSFYQEEYVDLYDFCFCLRNRCTELAAGLKAISPEAGLKTSPTLTDMAKACQDMIEVLEKGNGKLVTLAAFAGAAFQYSHGHSIYFPWTKPTEHMWEKQYEEYRLNRKTRWRDFLNVYFEKTMRKTREDELGEKGKPKAPKGLTDNILALIGKIGTHVFAGDGSLEKPGPDAPMGSRGPDDPFGSESCNCPTIKNYPSFTSTVIENGKEVPFHVSEDFLDGQIMVSDSNGS
jgi:Clostripain family